MKRSSGSGHAAADSGTISPETAPSVFLVIRGQLPSAKNRRTIYRQKATGRPFIGKNADQAAYEVSFALQANLATKIRNLGSESAPLRATVSVFYQSHRSDLSCEVVWDCLQKCGIISNDRWIWEQHLYKHIDKANPRVEI